MASTSQAHANTLAIADQRLLFRLAASRMGHESYYDVACPLPHRQVGNQNAEALELTNASVLGLTSHMAAARFDSRRS